jgi:hypothetical protein
MDTATPVIDQVDEGKDLVDHLKRSGFDVAVAFWVLTSEDRLWFLYIGSSVVETEGLAGAYRRLYSEFAQYPLRWISRSDIKLVGPNNPIAVDAIAYQSSNLPTRYRGRKLGILIVEEAYIYAN